MDRITLPECEECHIGENMRGSFERWVNYGIEPGGFGMAVLTNNLKEAAGRADVFNKANLANIVLYCLWYLPAACWGSPERVLEWQRMKLSQRAESA